MTRTLGAALVLLLAGAPTAGADDGALRARAAAALRVTKHIVAQPGVADTGRFDLRAAGPAVTAAPNVGDGGSTGWVAVPAGTYVVSESARRPARLSDYTPAISCRDTARGHTGSVAVSQPVAQVVVRPGDAWDCTITNTRRYAAVALDKTGPASAISGRPVAYALTVSNVGNVAFPGAQVSVSDAQCAAPGPALTSVNGDATPAALDPGDRWSYACSVPTTAGQARVDNTASVVVSDGAGRSASARSQASTALTLADEQPASAGPVVAPVAIRGGRATLYGPRGCPVRATTAFVKGRRVIRVTYFVDGRRRLTLTRANRGGHYTLRLQVRGLRPGVHRLAARIQFAGDSFTKTQTLRLTFVRCRGGAIAPSFTG